MEKDQQLETVDDQLIDRLRCLSSKPYRYEIRPSVLSQLKPRLSQVYNPCR
jgi:hypothetical protein